MGWWFGGVCLIPLGRWCAGGGSRCGLI